MTQVTQWQQADILKFWAGLHRKGTLVLINAPMALACPHTPLGRNLVLVSHVRVLMHVGTSKVGYDTFST